MSNTIVKIYIRDVISISAFLSTRTMLKTHRFLNEIWIIKWFLLFDGLTSTCIYYAWINKICQIKLCVCVDDIVYWNRWRDKTKLLQICDIDCFKVKLILLNWNRFSVLKFNFRCQIWNAWRRQQILCGHWSWTWQRNLLGLKIEKRYQKHAI